MAKIRWRLVMGIASLVAAVALTFPAGARAAGRLTADIWPNADGVLADIWPNTTYVVDIWPNGALTDIVSSTSGTPEGP